MDNKEATIIIRLRDFGELSRATGYAESTMSRYPSAKNREKYGALRLQMLNKEEHIQKEFMELITIKGKTQ